ncbi:hypothetical protein [Demequina sp. NBRC 110054]|uniref:hypothetical protein n=1 Tax=Demequina sp. NBRC 110054 TaxID=1570343 RepID=UPI001177C867|nr:hypothetical protein [Demequina sp. NBRC 110054]
MATASALALTCAALLAPAAAASAEESTDGLGAGGTQLTLTGLALPSGTVVVETETQPISADAAVADALEVADDLEVGESATLSSATSQTVVYAASSACNVSYTVYKPYRKLSSGSYWATSKVSLTRSSGCSAAQSYYSYLERKSTLNIASVGYSKFTVKPGYTTTSWVSYKCSSTSSKNTWYSDFSRTLWGDSIEQSDAASLNCTK